VGNRNCIWVILLWLQFNSINLGGSSGNSVNLQWEQFKYVKSLGNFSNSKEEILLWLHNNVFNVFGNSGNFEQ